MTKLQKLLQLVESPAQYNDVTHDILNLKTKIHNHQTFIKDLQNKYRTPPPPKGIDQKINFHKQAIDHLSDQLKSKQDRLSKMNHSASGAGAAAAPSAGAGNPLQGGPSASSVNNLGQLPVGPLLRKKKFKKV